MLPGSRVKIKRVVFSCFTNMTLFIMHKWKIRKFIIPLGALLHLQIATPTQDNETKPLSVLFVCLGNICRSPAAEGVFRDIVKKRGIDSKFNIDSAGTIGYHEGNMADPRMKSAAKRRGIEITSLSRPIKASDFRDFDLILAMDEQNKEDILNAYNVWKAGGNFPPTADKKVLDLLEDACESLLDSIITQN